MLATPSPAAAVCSALRTLAHGGIGSITAAIVLLTLREEGDTTISTLAGRAGCTPASMTGVLDRMETAGLIQRHHARTDRRTIHIRLLPPGLALLQRAAL